MGRIVVGVDRSQGARNALRWAAREAELHGWSVTAVMAWGFLEQHHIDTRQFDPDYHEPEAAAALSSFIAAALDEESAKRVQPQLTLDLAARGLLDASKDADLLVVGARGLGGFRGLLLGSVSQACLHRATCPVAVIRGDGIPGPSASERIVVGVDGSTGAQGALDWALDEARARGASITVVHGWNMMYAAGAYPYAIAIDPAPLEEAARALIVASLERANTDGLEGRIDQVTVIGGAASALLDTARGADLIVVGTRGAGRFRAMLLGSVSNQVAQHGECPVVVVPTAD